MRYAPRVPLISTCLVAAVVVLHEPVRGAALTILRFPFTVLRDVAGMLVALPSLPSLAREHTALRAELAQRQVETARLRELVRHAHASETLLNSSSPHGVVATVLNRSILPTQHIVLLDKGRRDGLALDSVILDAFGVIGRVAELHPSVALVMLLTDPESRIAVLVERSRESGLLVGRGRGQCELIYLDAHADLQAGDPVVTAGLGGSFPKGLRLGTVVRIVRDEEAGSTSAWVVPAARLGQLEEVVCLPATRSSGLRAEGSGQVPRAQNPEP